MRLRSISARVIVCTSPGAYSARNAGIAAAKWRVLAFTDADCIPDSNWISAGLTALQLSETSCIVGGEVEMRLSLRPTAVELYQYLSGFMQSENVHNRGFSATANLFVFKSHIADIGPFDEVLLSGGDREWSWRAAKAGYPVKFSADAIVVTSPRNSPDRPSVRPAGLPAGGTRCNADSGSMSHRPDSSRTEISGMRYHGSCSIPN